MNNNKKGITMAKRGEEMHTETVTDTITDKSAVLSLAQVKVYADRAVQRGGAEYNNGAILVRSKHPLDQCAKRGIIEDAHYDTGKAFITIRDCAFSNTHGRIYNDTGEGDSGIDAATLYVNTWRKLTEKQRALIKIICFAQPKPDGEYFSEMDYQHLYSIAPNIQSAFEMLNKAVMEARDDIKTRIAQAEKTQTQ